MQHRPDHPTLLDAVAQFLLGEVSPKLEADKALQFRALIAANLASVIANELRTEATRFDAEAARLRRLLPAEASALPLDSVDRATRLHALEQLNRALAAKLEAETLSPEAQAHVLEHLFTTAKETLEVTNPRFDLTYGT
ncbi:MAG: DUF6285 domain-containing protein [Myxococcaceae bacterium]|nr:DUF6285 domain-containing protein [Myxococcaceae bacterium]